MPRAFVLGASGFIGFAVAEEFRRRGYQVYGLTRTEQKAKELTKQEIIPVLGKAQDVAAWKSIATSSDVIVEAVADYQDPTTQTVLATTLKEIAATHKNITVIYTSGIWIHGATDHKLVDENSPLNPPKLVSGRPALEKLYLDAGAIVLRPACVFGKSGSLTGAWLSLADGKNNFPGTAQQYVPLVHVDDLAVAYYLAATTPAARGQVFNLVSQNENKDHILRQIAKVVGYSGPINHVTPADPFSECLALDQFIDNTKAKLLLSWQPTQPAFLGNVERYYNSWKALTSN